MCAAGSRRTRTAGFAASRPSSTAAFKQTTSVPSVLLTVLAASSPASVASRPRVHQLTDPLDVEAAERELRQGG